MAGRSGIGSRLVILVMAASTLLAAWVPVGQACACGSNGGPAQIGDSTGPVQPPSPCPCCGKRPAPGEVARPCCPARPKADTPAPSKCCGCQTSGLPSRPESPTPPRPSSSDDGVAQTSIPAAPLAGLVPAPAKPAAAESLALLTVPTPTDLVVSLSRFTC